MTGRNGEDSRRLTSFEHDGLVFDVADQGPLDGEIVVLLHGFPQTSSSWDALAPLLHASGYRTLAPDQRGYSPGARPRGRFAYRMSQLVGDVLALVTAAGPAGGKMHVVGHDWGAAVAWSLAIEYPERVAILTALSVPHPTAFIRFSPWIFRRSRRRGIGLLRNREMSEVPPPGAEDRALNCRFDPYVGDPLICARAHEPREAGVQVPLLSD